MKKLSEIKVNSSKLKLIIGENINYPFPTKTVITRVGKEVQRAQPETLAKIITGSSYARKRSHDERFDGKHPVELSVASILEKGLSKSIVSDIRNDYKCQRLIKITGKYSVLNDLISDSHREYIIGLLTETRKGAIEKFGAKYYNR